LCSDGSLSFYRHACRLYAQHRTTINTEILVAAASTGRTGGRRAMSLLRVTPELAEIDLDAVHRWLSTDAHWAIGRSRETVQRAAEASMNFGALAEGGELLGYARVVTDHATFAWLCDVYVDRAARGQGVGLSLATTVTDALRPLGLRRVLLATPDAHGLYAKVGFAPHPHPERLMQLGWPD
jgi:GNAT superfamily N-acetyltransferase